MFIFLLILSFSVQFSLQKCLLQVNNINVTISLELCQLDVKFPFYVFIHIDVVNGTMSALRYGNIFVSSAKLYLMEVKSLGRQKETSPEVLLCHRKCSGGNHALCSFWKLVTKTLLFFLLSKNVLSWLWSSSQRKTFLFTKWRLSWQEAKSKVTQEEKSFGRNIIDYRNDTSGINWGKMKIAIPCNKAI